MNAADQLRPLFESLIGRPIPINIKLWDGSRVGDPDAASTVTFRSPDALRRILFAPGELGFVRAYVFEDIEVEGDLHAALKTLFQASPSVGLDWRTWARTARAATSLGVLGRPLPPPPEEVRLHGRLHSTKRDRDAIAHHYNISNEFYELFLGPSMTYSCARFTDPHRTLEEAQAAKYELVCQKLALKPGMRLLDVGCGWGGMVLHAARHHGVDAVGVTISQPQYELATKRVAEAGLAGRVDIRLQDYREVAGEQFDAISSIGMAEHVGRRNLGEYFRVLSLLLRPEARLLNHAISTPDGAGVGRRTFMARYVFPDGYMPDVAEIVGAMQSQGLDVRDVEGLREHYALTLRHWSANLDANWDDACRFVGVRRARVWKLYLATSAVSFEVAEVGIHQVLGVKLTDTGLSGMPLTRVV